MNSWSALFRSLTADNVDNVDNVGAEDADAASSTADNVDNVDNVGIGPADIVNNVNIVNVSKGEDRQAATRPLAMVFAILERRCPAYVDAADWQQAVEDGRRFLATWGEQAEALGWTARDLFGLHTPPGRPAPSYRRLSRYDCTGLIWLLDGRPVVALTAETAAIQTASGGVLTYRKHTKPALGPVGDSLDDFNGAA